MKLQRYYVPLALSGPQIKKQLDKKVVQVEDDLSDFYLNGPRSWKPTINHTSYPPFLSKQEYDYSYEDHRYNDEMIQDEYDA